MGDAHMQTLPAQTHCQQMALPMLPEVAHLQTPPSPLPTPPPQHELDWYHHRCLLYYYHWPTNHTATTNSTSHFTTTQHQTTMRTRSEGLQKSTREFRTRLQRSMHKLQPMPTQQINANDAAKHNYWRFPTTRKKTAKKGASAKSAWASRTCPSTSATTNESATTVQPTGRIK